MLDIKFIKENQDLVKDAIRKKFVKLDLNDLISLDDRQRGQAKQLGFPLWPRS